MKQALIDITTTVDYCSGWELVNKKYQPIITTIQNSARVCEVIDQPFPVASPLFWTECDDNILADQWYYDTAGSTFIKVPDPAPKPVNPDQPVVSGAQDI